MQQNYGWTGSIRCVPNPRSLVFHVARAIRRQRLHLTCFKLAKVVIANFHLPILRVGLMR
jgi:hypothetical protein